LVKIGTGDDMRFEWVVGRADAERRLDRFLWQALQRELASISSSRVQKILRKGDVRINGDRAAAGTRLASGDRIVAHLSVRPGDLRKTKSPAPSTRTAEVYRGPKIAVLHEGRSVIVVNKPAGVSCDHGESGSPGLLSWAEERYAEDLAAGRVRPAAAHRLDRGTTGAVCLGLTAAALESFRSAQEEGRVHKVYWVVVWGRPTSIEFELSFPLKRLPHARRRAPKVVRAASDEEGFAARTEFRWIAGGGEASLLQARPLTGRTHQIRAHCRLQGLPVVGDPRYGDRARDEAAKLKRFLDHQLLHAKSLELDSAELGYSVEAPLPHEFAEALEVVGIHPPRP
jgi:23S rRNA pseudouridine955/2504/2580 synthase